MIKIETDGKIHGADVDASCRYRIQLLVMTYIWCSRKHCSAIPSLATFFVDEICGMPRGFAVRERRGRMKQWQEVS